jgi:hypothetical protein
LDAHRIVIDFKKRSRAKVVSYVRETTAILAGIGGRNNLQAATEILAKCGGDFKNVCAIYNFHIKIPVS